MEENSKIGLIYRKRFIYRFLIIKLVNISERSKLNTPFRGFRRHLVSGANFQLFSIEKCLKHCWHFRKSARKRERIKLLNLKITCEGSILCVSNEWQANNWKCENLKSRYLIYKHRDRLRHQHPTKQRDRHASSWRRNQEIVSRRRW